MKLIKALIITWSLTAQAGLPPTTLSGQSSATKPTTFGTQVPYNQATSLGGINSLIESGNENMLLNPNFEAPTLSGWTCTTGTCTVESTVFSSGKQSAKIVPAANIFDFSQQINTPANIQKQGVMGIVYNFPATCTTASVQTIVDGTAQTTVPTTSLILDGAFHSIEIPTTFGATSAKIRAFSTASCTGNIYLDASRISQGIGYQNLMLDNTYSNKITTGGTVYDENKDFINGNCTNSSPSVCTFNTGIFTVAPNCQVNELENASHMCSIWATTSSSVSVKCYNDGGTDNTTVVAKILKCQKSGNDYLASSANVYASQNANTDWAPYTPVYTNLGSVATVEAFHTRVGGNMYIKGRATLGVTVGASASIGLPLSNTVSSVFETSTAMVGGSLVNNSNIGNYTALATGGDNAISFGNVSTPAGLSKAVGTNIGSTGQVISWFIGPIPITGWSNSNVIVGSFDKIEKCTGATECVDVFSAQVTTTSGAVTNSNVLPNWITCTAANPTVCTFTAGIFTVVPNCGITSNHNSTFILPTINSINSTSVTITSTNSNTGANVASVPLNLSCQKSGVDSKPKTAKVASSIGVPTVPGITTEAIDTFSFNYGGATINTICSASPCAFLDQIGNAVSSVTRSALAAYTLNTVKTYTKLKCNIVANGSGGQPALAYNALSCSSCNAIPFTGLLTTSGAQIDTYGTVMCQGSY